MEPILSDFGPSHALKTLENGPIGDHKWLNSGSKTSFGKMILVHLACPTR